MPSNNTNKVSSSFSFGKGKHNMAAIVLFIVLLCMVVAYYFIYKSNRDEGFDSKKNSKSKKSNSSPPNLTPESDETVVALFYADWCPHCVDFKPDFEQAMEELNNTTPKSKKLRFEMVDCTETNSLSKEHNVSGYPTVKILGSDGKSSEYSGKRKYADLKKYLVND